MAKKTIEGGWTPIVWAMMDTPAWKATSPLARGIYISLKRRVRRGKNTAYLSYNDARNEVGSTDRHAICQGFRELEHYGFIVKVRGGCLGVNGKGEATIWRLTELGVTPPSSPTGLPEPPARDYQRWDGTKFKRKRRIRKTEPQSVRANRAGVDVSTRLSLDVPSRPVGRCQPRNAPNGQNPGWHAPTTTSLATPKRTQRRSRP
jgi:hypothetical protein